MNKCSAVGPSRGHTEVYLIEDPAKRLGCEVRSDQADAPLVGWLVRIVYDFRPWLMPVDPLCGEIFPEADEISIGLLGECVPIFDISLFDNIRRRLPA